MGLIRLAIWVLAAGMGFSPGAWARGADADHSITTATVAQERRAHPEDSSPGRAPAAVRAITPEYLRNLVPSNPGWYTDSQPWHLIEPGKVTLEEEGSGPLRGMAGSNVPAWRQNVYFRDFHWLPP